MSVVRAFMLGVGRVVRAPAILLGVYLATLLIALLLGLVVRAMLVEHLGSSLVAEAALSGVHYEWWQEFVAQAAGLGRTFTPAIIGFAPVLDNMSSVLDARAQPLVLQGAAAAYLLLWLFLSGGIIDRYARNRRIRAYGFFAAAGTFFFRFLRLGVIGVLVYWALFRYVHAWLFDDVYEWATRDISVERTAFGIRTVLYALFGALLVACNLVFDYARIRAVVEDRRSMIGALVAGTRFLVRRPGATWALYGVNGLLLLLILVLYALVAPGAAGSGSAMWVAFLITQGYLVARLASKLLFYASETAYFQGELSNTQYVAAPAPIWPEPPVSEAIGPPTT